MAKAKDLAALAGLAGLAYAYNKNKGNKDDSSKTDGKSGETTSSKKDADDNDTLARANREESSGLSTTKNSVVSAITSPKAASNDKAGSQGVIPPKSSTAVNPKKPAPKLETITTRKDPREAETGMSRGTRTPAKPASTSSSSEEGMKNYKPRSTPASPAKDTAVSAVKEAAKTVAKTAGQGPAGAIATAAKPLADKAVAASGYKVPTSEEAAANRQAVYDKVKGVGSSVVDYVKNFETPAERRSRERKESSGMKRGGAVKMASGGMAASRRGDGIAQRGKTRGKMC